MIKVETYLGLDIVKMIGVERILKIVCENLGVDPEDVKSKTRKGEIAQARHIFCYLAYTSATGHTLTEIGRFIGRDHATVLHSRNKIKDFLTFDKYIKDIVTTLNIRLGRFSNEEVRKNVVTEDHVGYYVGYAKKKKLEFWAKENDVVSKLNLLINI